MCRPIPVGWDQALTCASGAHQGPPMALNQKATQEPKQNVEPLSMGESSEPVFSFYGSAAVALHFG